MQQLKDSFECKRCSYSCMQLVLLSEDDIKNIKNKTNLKEKDFVDIDDIKRKWLKMDGLYCGFLKWDKGVIFCSIHGSHPKICREYPFFEDGIAECNPPLKTEDGSLIMKNGAKWNVPIKGEKLVPYSKNQSIRFKKK